MVSVPHRFNDELAQAHREKHGLEAELGHGIKDDDPRLSNAAIRTLGRAATRVDIYGATDEDGMPCELPLPDHAAQIPGEGRTEEYEILNNLIRELPSRLQVILRARFGFMDPSNVPTLETVARELGVSRERVRQLENSALCKLRQRLLHLKKQHHLQLTA